MPLPKSFIPDTPSSFVPDAPQENSAIVINHDENKSLGWRDQIINFWRPLSQEDQKAVLSKLGTVGGSAAIGTSNAFLGAASGAASFLLHPLQSVYGTAQTASDALNQMFPDSTLNPRQKAAKQASLDRLKNQWESIKENPDYALGNLAGGILAGEAAGEAPRAFKGAATKALEATREGIRSRVKGAVGISPLDIEDRAQGIAAANKEVRENTTQAEDLHRREVNAKAEDISSKEAVQAEKERIAHEKELKDAQEHNARIRAKHESVAKRIQEENAAQEHTLNLRHQLEDELTRKTSEHYALEDQKEVEAREKANAPWNRWHSRMDRVPVEQNEVFDQLKSSGALTPQVEEQLKFIEPDARSVEPASKYALTRSSIMENLGETKPYEDLPTYKQEMYDRMTQESGVHPEPIDLSPDAPATTIGKLQQARSVLEERIRASGGRGEHFDVGGVQVGRMKVVSRILGDIINKYSKDNGAYADLEEGRAATREFKEAFGKAPPRIRTQVGIREAWLNPESDAARAIEENLEKSSKVDPRLAESAKSIRALRDELKKVPSEDQLRKTQKQVPAEPTVNDLREGYRLREEPKPPVKKLTSGSPEERAELAIEPPPRAGVEESLTPEQIRSEQAQKIEQLARRMKHSPRGRGLSGSGFGWTWALTEAFRGRFGYAGAVAAARMTLSLFPRQIAGLLERPDVVEWISRPTNDEMRVYESLTPDQKAVFGESLNRLSTEATKKGITVSPKWKAIQAAGAASGFTGQATQKLRELREQQRAQTQQQ